MTFHTPLVSILIPCYNSAKYIGETLDSVMNQSYSNWECIVVDDHSTDNSVDIIRSYSNRYPGQIKIFPNHGKGACAARNLAFEKCAGEYIQYLDADDLICTDKIKLQVGLLKNSPNNVSVCKTWHFFNDINDAYNTDEIFLFSTEQPSNLLINLWGGNGSVNMIQTGAWLTPRNLISQSGLWNESLLKDQDGEFFARVVLTSKGIIYSKNAINYYRKHINNNNLSAQKKIENIESIFKATQQKEVYLLSKTRSPRAYIAIATQYKLVAIDAFPQYQALYKQAIKKCNKLGGSNYLPVMGGKTVENIKKLFGWRAAKLTSWIWQKITINFSLLEISINGIFKSYSFPYFQQSSK